MSTITSAAPAVADLATGRFTIGYRVLVAALKDVGLAVATRPATPVLGSVLVVVGDGIVTLTGFDFDAAVTVTLDADNTAPGRMLLPQGEVVKVLTAAVKGSAKGIVDREVVTVEVADGAPVLSVAGYGIPLAHSIEVGEFPELPQTTPGTHVVDRAQFAELISRVGTAADTPDVLPILSGLKVDLGADNVTVTATDRYRLATGTVPAAGTTQASTVLSAALTTKLVARLEADEITLGLDTLGEQHWVTVACGSTVARVRALEGSYPRVGSIIAESKPTTVVIDRELLHKAAVRASALMTGMGERNSAAIIAVGEHGITLAPTRDGEPVDAPSIDAVVDSQSVPWRTGVNPAFLVAALNTMIGDRIVMHLSEPAKPLKFTDDGSLDYLHLLMPVRFPGR